MRSESVHESYCISDILRGETVWWGIYAQILNNSEELPNDLVDTWQIGYFSFELQYLR